LNAYCQLLDHIAIPDFPAGAMENWGLVTYLMRSLLYNEEESSSSDKQWVALVVAHELAHQVAHTCILNPYMHCFSQQFFMTTPMENYVVLRSDCLSVSVSCP